MLAPGIQYVQVEAPKPSEDALRPDIAGFAGIFERGPILVPRRIEDWGEHRSEFGAFLPVPGSGAGQALAPLALYGFFQNGGGSAILFRFGSRAMRAAKATVVDPATGAWIGIAASSPGAWANPRPGRPPLTLRVPLVVTMSRVLAAGFPADTAQTGLADGDIARVFDASGAVALGTLRASGAGKVTLAAAAGMTAPLVVEVIAPDVDVTIEGGETRERLRGLSLEPEAANNVWRALAPARSGPEWAPEVPTSWQPLPDELALALAQQGPGLSRYLRATRPEGWPGGVSTTLPAPWRKPSTRTVESARGAMLEVVLDGGEGGLDAGDDALGAMDAATVQAAIAVLARHPLPSLVAIPDLMLPVTRADPPCAKIPAFDRRRSYPAKGSVEPAPAPPPSGALPTYGPSTALLQEELLRAIWATREGRAERIALLDPPPALTPAEAASRAATLRAAFALDDPGFRPAASGAMFYPWIRALDPASGAIGTVLVPPSGHVAGIMARTSRETGAGARFGNESVAGAVALERALSDDERGDLNASAVAALHAVAGRGPSIFGARTLSTERRADSFIPAARVLAFVRRTLRVLGEALVFEPNDALLRERVRVSVELTLRALFRSGAFAGRTPEESFAVRCDAQTTPPAQIELGRVIAEVDVALAAPLEFITLRVAFSRDGSGVLDDVPHEEE